MKRSPESFRPYFFRYQTDKSYSSLRFVNWPKSVCLELPLLGAKLTVLSAVGHLISAITQDHEKDPRQIIRPLDSWRMSLAEKLQIRDQAPDDDIYYAELRGSSYRFETMICRLIRHRRPRDTDRCEWARQRLRSAMFELDAITRRMLEKGAIQEFPVSLSVRHGTSFCSTVKCMLTHPLKF